MEKQLKIRGIVFLSGILIFAIESFIVAQRMMSAEQKLIVFLVAYLIIGFGVFRELSEDFMNKEFFNEKLLIVLATVGAFGVGRYQEAVVVMLLFELGKVCEAIAVDRTKRMIASKIDIRPEYATRIIKGREFQVKPSALKLYNTIIIKPGERIPVDAEIISGRTTIDTKALTGESIPKEATVGDLIYSGTINLNGVIEAKVLKTYEESTVSRVMEMVEEAHLNKSDSEGFVQKFTKIYTPVVAIIALSVILVPPMTFSLGNWDTWIYRGLVVMIAACPVGIILSTPVAFLGGIASAARQGILVKGGNYLENLAKADTFIFDKTGTLTEGVFKVSEIKAIGMSEEEMIKMCAHVECYSNHPIAQSLQAAYTGKYDRKLVRKIHEEPGFGISATYDDKRVHIGNYYMTDRYDVQVERVKSKGTVLYVIVEDRYAGYVVITDEIKEGAKWTLRTLKESYNAILVMLTGDSKSSAKRVARALRMDYAYTNLLPEDKLEHVEEFVMGQDSNEKVVCIGDGINDAPILARADVGIAMGALGSAAAIEAADIVLMKDELPRIIDAIKIAKETMRVVTQNVSFAIVIKFIILALAVIGYATMWEAVFADVAVMLIAILNSAWVIKYTA